MGAEIRKAYATQMPSRRRKIIGSFPAPATAALRPGKMTLRNDGEITGEKKATVLSIEELEAGLRMMGQAEFGRDVFWDANVDMFRQTVLFSICETSDALLSPSITSEWRGKLEAQLQALVRHVELADRYLKSRRSRSAEQTLN
jgi:hypothetical protein